MVKVDIPEQPTGNWLSAIVPTSVKVGSIMFAMVLPESPFLLIVSNRPPTPVSVGYVPPTPTVTVVGMDPTTLYLLMVPVNGKCAEVSATEDGTVANVPLFMPTLGVEKRSCDVTK